jgi:hypothetical protein
VTTIWLPDGGTWPENVLAFLQKNVDVFDRWYNREEETSTFTEAKHVAAVAEAHRYDQAILALSEELKPHSLRGYHCTRLTDQEIDQIKKHGMSLPDTELLYRRIDALIGARVLTKEAATKLKSKNQADEQFRKSRIWFCFYEPLIAGQGGIEDLLRHWGGEALYNSHDRDEELGPLLRSIGMPCLVEVDAPITSLRSIDSLSIDVARVYATKSTSTSTVKVQFEACVLAPLLAPSIINVIRFTHPEFRRLTGCEAWSPPLKC